MIELVISFLVFTSYVAYIYVVYGEQKSISDSVYRFTGDQKWIGRAWFILTLYLLTIPMARLVSDYTTYLPFGILTISIVGSTFNLQSSNRIKTLHYIGAIGGIAATLMCLWLELGYWQAPAAMLIFGGGLAFLKNRLWKIEILAFAIIWVTLLIHTVK